MKKRISRNPAEQTPFERFYLEFPVLMERAGGVVYGKNRLAEIGWGQRAAELLWDALGRPDYRGEPMPPESHGGDWIGIADDPPPLFEAGALAAAKDDPFACLDGDASADPFACLDGEAAADPFDIL
jgi:hypothetical protein